MGFAKIMNNMFGPQIAAQRAAMRQSDTDAAPAEGAPEAVRAPSKGFFKRFNWASADAPAPENAQGALAEEAVEAQFQGLFSRWGKG